MASSVIGALRVNLGLDSAQFSKGLKGSQRDMQGFAQKMRAAMMPVAVAMTAMVGGLEIAVKGQLNQADEMSKAAQKFGVPIEQLSRLKYAGDMSGVSMETLGISLGQLSKKMQAAMGGGAAAKMFEDLGISVKDAAGNMRSTEDVLGQFSDVLAKMPDGPAKTALAMQVLGKSGAEIIPMLNGGSESLRQMAIEAEAMGLVIDEKTGKAAENFNDNLSRLKGTLTGLVMQLTAALAPALEKISAAAVDVAKWFQKLSPETKAWAAAIAATVAAIVPALVAVGAMAGSIGIVSTAIKALTLLFLGNPLGIGFTVIASGAAVIYANWEGLSKKFAEIWQAVTQEFDFAWLRITSGVIGAYEGVKQIWSDIKGYFSQKLAELPAAFSEAWEQVKAVTAQWYADFLAIGGHIVDGLREGIKAKWDAMVEWFTGLGDNMVESMKGIFDINSPSRVFRAIGRFITEGLGLGIKDNAGMATGALDGVANSIIGQTASLSAGMDSFRDSARSTFISIVTGAQKAGAAIKQLAAGFFASQASKYAGLAFDGIASLFGFAKGGAFAGGKQIAFAKGGVVSSATNFAMASGNIGLMGEAGPEAIMPLTRGAGGKLGVQASGGSQSLSVSIGFDQSSGSFTAFVRDQAGKVVASATPQIITQAVGATYSAAKEVPIG